jgi:hypothetical protein
VIAAAGVLALGCGGAPLAEPRAALSRAADGSCTTVGDQGPAALARRVSMGAPMRRFTYRRGRLVTIERGVGTSPERLQELHYDDRGRLSETRDGQAGPDGRAFSAAVDTYAYRDTRASVLIHEVRGTGETVDCVLDRGRSELRCEGHDPGSGDWTSMKRYDARGRLIAEQSRHARSHASDMSIAVHHDDSARVVTETRDFQIDGRVHREDTTSYDRAGRVVHTRTRGPTATSKLATLETSVSYELDPAGRVRCATTVSTTDEGGPPAPAPASELRCYGYDDAGNITRTMRATAMGAADESIEVTTYDGVFHEMRCGRLPRSIDDDPDLSEIGQVWEEQIRAMLRE